MNLYKNLKDRHAKEFNEFPMFFAYSMAQFDAGMSKLGLDPSEKNKIYCLGGGGYYRKVDSERLKELLARHSEDMENNMANSDDFLYDMFYYELGNHEYVYTGSTIPTLEVLGITQEEVNASVRMSQALSKACRKQREKVCD